MYLRDGDKLFLIGMAEELRSLQREILKARRHLSSLEARFQRLRTKVYGKPQEDKRLMEIEKEFKTKYPNLPVRREVLALVGTEPYNPPSEDKEITRYIVAERYD